MEKFREDTGHEPQNLEEAYEAAKVRVPILERSTLEGANKAFEESGETTQTSNADSSGEKNPEEIEGLLNDLRKNDADTGERMRAAIDESDKKARAVTLRNYKLVEAEKNKGIARFIPRFMMPYSAAPEVRESMVNGSSEEVAETLAGNARATRDFDVRSNLSLRIESDLSGISHTSGFPDLDAKKETRFNSALVLLSASSPEKWKGDLARDRVVRTLRNSVESLRQAGKTEKADRLQEILSKY